MWGSFWSYVHSDNEHDNGRIGRLCDRLQRSICFFSGKRDFRIFLDRKDIGWGEKWAARIASSIEDTLLLFPIITPSYFSSAQCREEVLAFQQRQSKLVRDDLILPIYYVASPLMSEENDGLYVGDEAAVGKLLSAHQYQDWRSLRSVEETDPSYGLAIERLAQQATAALRRTLVDSGRSVASTSGAATSDSSQEREDTALASAKNLTRLSAADPPGHVVTLTVNQMPGRGQFTTLSEAVARAPGGAKIIVAPGHYRECVVIDKPLELVGDGARDDIVLEAATSGPETLIFDTNIGAVRNFTLRQNREKDFCVWIKQGRLELEDCDIVNAGGTGLVVSEGADPRIRRNRIHHCGASGIGVDDARGTFENNEIFANKKANFSVKGMSDPVLRKNLIYDSGGSGIYISEGGRGLYEDNEIFANKLAGMSVTGAADVLVRRNRIYDGKSSGIFMYGDARGTLDDNEIFGNAFSGISIKTGGSPVVRRNQIYHCKDHGVFVYDKGKGTIENNAIFENQRAGIFVDDSNVSVVGNRINKNGYEAVWVKAPGSGIFTDNDLTDNKRGPWDIDKSAEAQVQKERNRE